MPSLFSRSKATFTPTKKQSLSNGNSPNNPPTLDEFGRVSTTLSALSINGLSPGSKKDKKKAKEQEKRLRASGSPRDRPESRLSGDAPSLPDGSFLPLSLERPRGQSGTDEQPVQVDYGYLSYERHVVLGVEQLARLVIVISDELATRGGITTPFIFSNTALDISSAAIKRIIRAFLATCAMSTSYAAAEAESKWREEARFAGPHELGMCLRWGLARVVRSVGGRDVRGLIPWEHYLQFKDSEAARGYPPIHFSTFLEELEPTIQSILIALLTLLSRLTANSTASGHTPPTLSPLFGPLIFGLGPSTLPFHHTYIHYLRAVGAMEHLQLAFIRWQDVPQSSSSPGAPVVSGSLAALGVPIRLKEWIKGYPSMLTFLQDPKNQKPQPRRGARTVRIMTVRRNVRMYSPDLVRTAASWATRASRSANSSGGSSPIYTSYSHANGPSESRNGLLLSKEWSRIAPASLKLQPRYSEGFKKRMNMPSGLHPDMGPGSPNTSPLLQAPSLSNTTSASSYVSSVSSSPNVAGDEREREDRFRSLTDLKWGEFENLGFSGLGETETKLQFDLTEGARNSRSTKRETLSWSDFSAAGFSRSDGPLSATLQFSSPVTKAISTWPTHQAEMSKKLKKTEKSLPPFGWDTEPVVGNEEVIEEAFIDVFCDLVYGGGWMDLERVEELDRDCNWALIEFKALPLNQTSTTGTSDPRTSNILVLFEEFVPLEYRQQLAVGTSNRRKLPSLFTPSKSKQWKQAATLNGRPYVVGHVPRSPSYRELEFEGLLNGAKETKVITLGQPKSRVSTITTNGQADLSLPGTPMSASIPKVPANVEPLPVPKDEGGLLDVPTLHSNAGSGPRSEEGHNTDYTTKSTSTISTKRSSRFRLPVPLISPGGRRTGIMPSEYDPVEFETRMASYSDDDFNNREERDRAAETEDERQKRKEGTDDAWVDILVGDRAARGRRSDPDLASLEVAQVLASVRERTISSSSSLHHQRMLHDRVDGDHAGGLERFYNDQDVDEIETVPRTSDARSRRSDDDDETLDSRDAHQGGADADDEDDFEQSPAQRLLAESRKRRGYFDLHPERKGIASPADILRASQEELRETDADSDDEQLPETPLKKYSESVKQPLGTITALKVHLNTPEQETTSQNNVHDSPSPLVPPSKTAALIEMYRERERGISPKLSSGSSHSPMQASRLPVRPSTLPKEGASPFAPAVEITTLSKPEPELLPEPTKSMFEETGRASPARYVHGAPLHNVMEEEEEE